MKVTGNTNFFSHTFRLIAFISMIVGVVGLFMAPVSINTINWLLCSISFWLAAIASSLSGNFKISE